MAMFNVNADDLTRVLIKGGRLHKVWLPDLRLQNHHIQEEDFLGPRLGPLTSGWWTERPRNLHFVPR